MNHNFRVVRILFLAGVVFLFRGVPSAYADNDCGTKLTMPVAQLGNSGATGSAVLCISENGLQARMQVGMLVPGNAYTVWFVYFDNPSTCVVAGCGAPDLTSPVPDSQHPDVAPAGVFGRMDSAVADEKGNARFTAKLQNFKVSSGSLVWLAVFTHGPASADNQARAHQLLTPESPGLGFPGLGLLVRKGFGAALAAFPIPNSN